jgi:DNA-binding transcriptional ArsR family regulator
MEVLTGRKAEGIDQTAAYADMFAALGAEPRLQIVRALLAAHPDGMVVGEIQADLGIAASTLSHHLEKLKNERLIKVRRESTFLRYTANYAEAAGCAIGPELVLQTRRRNRLLPGSHHIQSL